MLLLLWLILARSLSACCCPPASSWVFFTRFLADLGGSRILLVNCCGLKHHHHHVSKWPSPQQHGTTFFYADLAQINSVHNKCYHRVLAEWCCLITKKKNENGLGENVFLAGDRPAETPQMVCFLLYVSHYGFLPLTNAMFTQIQWRLYKKKRVFLLLFTMLSAMLVMLTKQSCSVVMGVVSMLMSSSSLCWLLFSALAWRSLELAEAVHASISFLW